MRRYEQVIHLTIGNVVAAGFYSPAAKAVIIITAKGYLMKPSLNGELTLREYVEEHIPGSDKYHSLVVCISNTIKKGE